MKTTPDEFINAMLDPNGSFVQYGLTIRQHFSAMAMQGWISATELKGVPMDAVDNMPRIAARWAVEYADALIEALNKEEQ